MSPTASHDDIARFNFLANFNKYMAGVVVGGNAVAFKARAVPKWATEHGAPPANRREIREAMRDDPYYRMWSSLRRSGMEMRQQAGRSLVLRQMEALRDRARALNEAHPQTLRLDPGLQVPRYQSELDNHCMPGSYYAEYIEDDVAAAANYDVGMFATTTGLFGRYLDGAGRGTVEWLRRHRPGWSPRRILDLGTGLGHNVLPIARAFPKAEIVAVDLAAPMLRYGHARAIGMGITNVTFQQANAESLSFESGHFDFIFSTMFLHETSRAALRHILSESKRLLAAGGVQIHLEQPPYRDMAAFEQFMRDWDCQHNNEPFWSALHDTRLPQLMMELGYAEDRLFETEVHALVEDEMPKVSTEVEDYGRGGMWYACGADA